MPRVIVSSSIFVWRVDRLLARRVWLAVSPLTQIDTTNVASLAVAWTYHTGEMPTVDLRQGLRNAPFEIAEYEVTSPPAIIDDIIVVVRFFGASNKIDRNGLDC